MVIKIKSNVKSEKVDISVVIPAFNVECYIEDAIKSVLKQSTPPKEIIVVDDGSTDQTSKIIEKYSNNGLVKSIRTSNSGLGAARNLGRELSVSEYVYFFDSDDLLNSNFIEALCHLIIANNNPEIVFFSGCSFFDNNYKVEEGVVPPPYSRNITKFYNNSTNSLIYDLIQSRGFFASACLYVSKKSLWDNNDLLFKSIIHEDEEVILKLIMNANSALVVNDVYFMRRIRAGSTMTSGPSRARVNGYRVVIETFLDIIKSGGFKCSRDISEIKKRTLRFTRMYVAMANEIGIKIDYSLLAKVFFRLRFNGALRIIFKQVLFYFACKCKRL